MLSLCELIVGGKEGLQPIEKTVIDRCVRLVYRELALGIGSGDMPLLQDLYEELLRQPEPEAKRVATALELYCTGSLNLFNHHTNVQTDARVVCIVLKGMGENLRKIAMHITNEFVTSAVNTNHAQGLATWGYFDEFHYICTVTLENFNLSHLPIYIMGEDKLSRYALYMATLGNRIDLFPTSSYVGKYTSEPFLYEVPEEYLANETFAAIYEEAQKYIGYPYVWGGYKPSTSFDCSGYVSWVYNQCGWDFGRLGAQGLYNISTRVRNPQPGDLVFFTGTYDTPGVSHVGIYVGDGWMLHCGDPIGYADLSASYWQSHFYAYGRLS